MSDHRERITKAVHGFYDRQTPRERKRKNGKPEKITESDVLLWSKANGLHLHVVDAGTYNPLTRGRSVAKAESGFPDLVGNTLDGLSLYIELKAKDKRNAIGAHQRVFLERKIAQNCFAVVVDSASRLEQYWRGFHQCKSQETKRAYLLDCLPKMREAKDSGALF